MPVPAGRRRPESGAGYSGQDLAQSPEQTGNAVCSMVLRAAFPDPLSSRVVRKTTGQKSWFPCVRRAL